MPIADDIRLGSAQFTLGQYAIEQVRRSKTASMSTSEINVNLHIETADAISQLAAISAKLDEAAISAKLDEIGVKARELGLAGVAACQVEKLLLVPGDVLVFKVPNDYADRLSIIVNHVRDVLPDGIKIMIIPHDIDLAILRKTDS